MLKGLLNPVMASSLSHRSTEPPRGTPATLTYAETNAAPALLPLEVRQLSYEAGGRRIIDSLGLTLGAAGTTAVMGPNGAGKSLFLRLINGLLVPTSGEVSWAGRSPDRDVQARLAFVFQKPVLLRRSVAENIDFVLRRHHRADPKRRDALLERVGLAELGRQPARRLSGGEQQRLALARAIAVEPEVLMLDEPTASLDPASALLIEDIIREERAAGVRVFLVTHDIGQARRLADDVVFLRRGRLAEHSSAERFFENPASPAARDFLAGRIVL